MALRGTGEPVKARPSNSQRTHTGGSSRRQQMQLQELQ